MHVSFEHGHSHHESVGEVVDFSGEGVALAVDAGAALYLSGDPIPRVRIFQNDTTFYDGAAVIRNIRESDGRTIIGLAFQNSFMDLGKVYHLDLRRDLEQRFGAFFDRARDLDRLVPEFKAWVADTKYFLDQLSKMLEVEESRIADLDKLTSEIAARETVDLVAEGVITHLNALIAELNRIVGAFSDNHDQHEIHRAYFQHHLSGHFYESPFMRRAARKPLGYAGDYEVMNMLERDPREGRTLFGRILNKFASELSAARAISSRAALLTAHLGAALKKRPAGSIASFGCGPARDIRGLLDRFPELEGYTVTLLDLEPQAIQFCEKVLLNRIRECGRQVQVRFIHESVRDLVRERRLDAVIDPQDVLISSGLFDYFGDKMFQHLLRQLYALLKPGGLLLVGNMSPRNDTRYFMEYVAEWFLHYRSEEDLLALATCLPRDARVAIEAEPLGVNLFLRIERPLA